MATSCNFQEGQDVMACQLCEETLELKWKCVTCDFLMCTRCCKIHQKVKSTGDHHVVNIKDLTIQTEEAVTGVVTKKDFTKINCGTHDGQMCCLFCLDCNGVVCPLCIASIHNKHKMEEINKRYEFCVQKLEKQSSQLERESKDLKLDAETLETTRSTEEQKFETVKQKILHQEIALKNAVEQHTKKLLNDLDQKWNNVDNSISCQKTKISERNHFVKEEKNRISHALTSQNINDVFQTAFRRVTENLSGERLNCVKEKIPDFVKGEINNSKMESFHGVLSNQKPVTKIDFEIVEKYQTNYAYIENILSCEDRSLWITHDENMLENISLSNGHANTNRDYKIGINNIALMPNGDLLIATGKNELRIIPRSTGQIKISQFRIDANLNSAAVHVTKDNKILVGAFKCGPAIPENIAERVGQVFVFNNNGRRERVYGSVDNKSVFTLFTTPLRITMDSHDNIYVMDVLSCEKGRVVILNPWGGVTIYKGHPVENQSKLMDPADLVVTKSDHVILTDRTNYALHVLNSEGQCIAYQATWYLGIEKPFCLDIDNRGFLMIGCLTEQAKIHVVKFSGF